MGRLKQIQFRVSELTKLNFPSCCREAKRAAKRLFSIGISRDTGIVCLKCYKVWVRIYPKHIRPVCLHSEVYAKRLSCRYGIHYSCKKCGKWIRDYKIGDD
jgi:hypothetical protein